MIFVDKHEKGGVKEHLTGKADEIKQYNDFGGDYAVGDYLIERKRWRELAGRMMETDRHLYYQLEKLEKAAELMNAEPALLIEGNLGAALQYTNSPRERMTEYLTGVSIMGVQTMLSTCPENTATILAKLEKNETPDVERVRGSPPSREEEPRYIVEGIQGLGPSTAKTLLKEFETVEGIVNAPEQELQTVRGIGPKTAAVIHEAFRTKYE